MARLWRGMGGMVDPSRCFSVHDCSPLFTIVRHCSAKNITPEPVSPLRPHRQRGLYGFHETRNTRHETRNVSPFGSPWEQKRHITKNLRPATVSLRPFAWPCAAWRGYGAAWAAVVPRTGNTACWIFTSHEARNMVFPRPCGHSKENNPKPDQQVFTNHETRLFVAVGAQGTHNQKLPPGLPCTPPGRCFPARCGTAWRGYGAAWAAAVRLTGNTACWVFTIHEARNTIFPVPAATPRKATPSPTNRFSRNTNHGLYSSLPIISHHFPLFPGKKFIPEPVSAHRQTSSVGLAANIE